MLPSIQSEEASVSSENDSVKLVHVGSTCVRFFYEIMCKSIIISDILRFLMIKSGFISLFLELKHFITYKFEMTTLISDRLVFRFTKTKSTFIF